MEMLNYINAIIADGVEKNRSNKFFLNPNLALLVIVIPALNEELYIRKTIEHLDTVSKFLGFEYIFEVLVVDNDSDDKTVQVVESLCDGLNYKLSLVSEQTKGVGNARKTGADCVVYRNLNNNQTKGIVFSDADTYLSPSFIMTVYDRCLNSKYYVGSGEVYFDLPPRFSLVFNCLAKDIRKYGANHLGYTCPFGNALAISLDAYTDLGGISDQITYEWGGRIKPHFGEDFDIGIKCRLLGIEIEHLGITAVSSGRRFLTNPELCDGDLFYHPEHITLSRTIVEFSDISEIRALNYWQSCSVNMMIDFVLKPFFLDKSLLNGPEFQMVFDGVTDKNYWYKALSIEAPEWLNITTSLISRTAYLDYFYKICGDRVESIERHFSHIVKRNVRCGDSEIQFEFKYREYAFTKVFGMVR